MQLIIESRVYNLVEIPAPYYKVYTVDMPDLYTFAYIEHEEVPNMDFDHFHFTGYNVTKYRAIPINGKFYAPKLVKDDAERN